MWLTIDGGRMVVWVGPGALRKRIVLGPITVWLTVNKGAK